MTSRRVGIIGHGRFGNLWARLLAPHHEIVVTDRTPQAVENFVSLPQLCEACEAIFLCVPINQCEVVVREIAPLITPGTTVFDTCSVKVHPAAVMLKHLRRDGVTLVATHPMFGPDSAARGVQGLPLVLWQLAGDRVVYREWLAFFDDLGMRTVELSPDEHDQLAAYSQGVTHYVGRVLRQMELVATPIDTQGFKLLCSLIEQTCNDSWELFYDLQMYNPYTREMRERLEAALGVVAKRLENQKNEAVKSAGA